MPVLIFLNEVLWRALLARNQQYLDLRVAVMGLIVRVATSYLFIRWFDYLGAAIALTSNYVFYVLFRLYYIWKIGAPVLLFQSTWRFIVAATIMGALSWFLGQAMGFHLLINIPVSAAQDDLELFRSVIRRRAKTPAGVSS
jgi:O-antigen/teichoic acid export membrane protein